MAAAGKPGDEDMNRHYSEADLLETYYTQPGQSMPVMMHLAECEECAARYERLESKLRALGSCETAKPDSFWAGQRASILKKVESRRGVPRVARIAAAAVIVLLAGGVSTLWRGLPRQQEPIAVVATVATSSPATAEAVTNVAADPWQSDELKDYQSMVAWESWVDKGSARTGDQSL